MPEAEFVLAPEVQSLLRPRFEMFINEERLYARRIDNLLGGISGAREQADKRHEARMQRFGQLLTSNVHFDDALREELLAGVEEYGRVIAEDLESTMRAAAIILTHSFLDDALNRLLKIAMYRDLERWYQVAIKASSKKYAFEELATMDWRKERSRLLLAYLDRQKHRGVVERNELLLSTVGVATLMSAEKRMSKDDLLQFDRDRHDLVHASALIRSQFAASEHDRCTRVLGHVRNLAESTAVVLGFDWYELQASA